MMSLLENVTSETLPHFFICYPILLDDVLDDMICMFNTDAMFTLDDVNKDDI